MSRFFVGQMARLVRPKHPEHYGSEVRIVALFPERQSFSYRVNCEVVTVVGCVLPRTTPWTHTDRLEPIIPEGMQPAKWEDCMWQPEHLREVAA